MFGRLLAFLPAWVWLVAAGVVLAATSAFSYSVGSDRTQAAWDRAELQRERAAAEQRIADGKAAARAVDSYLSWQAEQDARQADIARRLDDALKRPLTCPAGARLGDLVLPRDVLDRLRDAGADGGAARAP